MKLKIENFTFNVLDTGAGKPALVFLHYWGGSARTLLPHGLLVSFVVSPTISVAGARQMHRRRVIRFATLPWMQR